MFTGTAMSEEKSLARSAVGWAAVASLVAVVVMVQQHFSNAAVETKTVVVDGVTCVQAMSRYGVALDCNWEANKKKRK